MTCQIGLSGPNQIGPPLGLRLWGPKQIGLLIGLGLWGPKQIGLLLGLGLWDPNQIGLLLGLGLWGPNQIGLLLGLGLSAPRPDWTPKSAPLKTDSYLDKEVGEKGAQKGFPDTGARRAIKMGHQTADKEAHVKEAKKQEGRPGPT
jgi:hypothetical protein